MNVGQNELIWNDALIDTIGHQIGAKVGDPLDGMALVPVQALREPPKWDGNVYTYHF